MTGALDSDTVAIVSEATETTGATYPMCAAHCQFEKQAQAFFANLAREIRSVHFGDQQRTLIVSLLHRAEEAGLYSPELEP